MTLTPTPGDRPMTDKPERLFVQFGDSAIYGESNRAIRRWSAAPFDDGTEYVRADTRPASDGLVEALERWRNNLVLTRQCPMHGDDLHGHALDFVIDQLEGFLALTRAKGDANG